MASDTELDFITKTAIEAAWEQRQGTEEVSVTNASLLQAPVVINVGSFRRSMDGFWPDWFFDLEWYTLQDRIRHRENMAKDETKLLIYLVLVLALLLWLI